MKKIFYGWWIVAACFLINLYVAGVVWLGLTGLIDPIVKEFGWSYTQISFAASLRGLEMGIFAPLVGFFTDYFGPRKLVFLGITIVGTSLILLSFTQSLIMFYASFLLLSLGAGGCTAVVLMSVIANWFDKNIGKAMGIMASGVGASGVMVPIMVWLIDVFHWRTALVFLGLGIFVIGIPLSFIIRNRPEEMGYLPDGRSAEMGFPTKDSSPPAATISYGEAFRMKSFLYLNIVEAVRMMIVMGVVTHVMPFLQNIGLPRSTAGLVAAATSILSIIGRLSFGMLADRYDKRYTMALAFSAISLGSFIFAYSHIPWCLILFLILFPSGYGGTMVLRGAIIREYYGRDSFGKLIGIVMGSASFGGILGPTLAGWVFDTTTRYDGVWLFFGITAGISTLLVLNMKPERKS